MAKAIKHIKAGLLNIEVIGQIPDPEKRHKSRASKSKATSAAQAFYNNKCSWRELELMIAANFTGKDHVITFTYDNAHLPKDKKAGGVLFQKFIRKLRTVRKRRGEELKYIFVTEGFHERREDDYFGGDGVLENGRIHHHVVINSTGSGDLEELRSLWTFGGYLRAEKVDIHYYQALAQYLTKEAREFGRPKPGERTWRASRNLTKYEVDYIEIPSDSVTLTMPFGAVDYTSFHETNPYGYADCIGARYLMYPEERPEYSYAQGRNPRSPNNFKP